MRKETERIDRFAVAPNFKIQHGLIGRPLTHVADHLAFGNFLPIVHQRFAIVRIGGEQVLAMLDDDEISVASNAAAGIDDPPRRGRTNILTQLSI